MQKIPYDITFHPSWWHKNAGISFGRPFFEDAGVRLQSDVKMRRTLYEHFGEFGLGEKDPAPRPILGSDMLACGYLHSELLGCPVQYSDGDSPQVQSLQMTLEDAEKLELPRLSEHPLWQNQLRQMEALYEQFGAVIPSVNLMGIQNIAFDLLGAELYTAYYEEPDIIHGLLEKITDMSIEIGLAFQRYSRAISAGVTGIVSKTVPGQYLTSNCTVDLISRDFYEEFLLPCDNRLADALGDFGIHHCGGHMERVAQGYAKVRDLCFAEVGYGSDIAQVRAALPGVYLNLRYSPVKLGTATESEMAAEITGMIEQSGNRLTSISCVGIDSRVSDSQIKTFLKVCQDLQR